MPVAAPGGRRRQRGHRPGESRVLGRAVDVGTWTSTGQRGHQPAITVSDRYLVVWVREADGRWRMLYDMWHRPAS